jgi:hypothetical protein
MANSCVLAAIAGNVLMLGGVAMSYDPAYAEIWRYFLAFGAGMIASAVMVQVLTWYIFWKEYGMQRRVRQ